MYIPTTALRGSPPAADAAAEPSSAPGFLSVPSTAAIEQDVAVGHGTDAQAATPLHGWLRRQFSDNADDNKNTQIGIAVGVVLGLFLIAACVFLYKYRGSIRCSSRKKRHGRHKSGSSRGSRSSRSSRSSKASYGGQPQPDAEPGPEPEPEPAA
jgi:hypothetical protein